MNNQKSFQKTLKISSSERGNMIKKELSSEEILFKSGKEKIMKQRKSIFDNEYEEGEKYNHKEYEDEEIKVDTSFRQYIDSILKTEKFNNIISLISFIFAIFIFFGYIVCTYFPLYNMKWFDITNVAIATFYNLETIKNFYLSQHRIIYLLSFQTIVELFTSIYPYFCFIRNYYNLKVLELARVLHLFRITKYLESFKYIEDNLTKAIIDIAISLSIAIFFLLQFSESLKLMNCKN